MSILDDNLQISYCWLNRVLKLHSLACAGKRSDKYQPNIVDVDMCHSTSVEDAAYPFP